MRSHLFDPTAGDPRLPEALALGREIYARFETGSDYSPQMYRLGLIAGRPIHGFSVHDAFGSVNSEVFARRQLIDWADIPNDLTEIEMLEMIDGVIGAIKADELQRDYWIECLKLNTGDQNIVGLIFWPGSYFGDGDNMREMTPTEILMTALNSGNQSR